MFSLPVLAIASLAASANALVIPRSTPPPTYAEGYLEPYTTYHTRYIALSCQTQHGNQFFDDCCHPMLATENLKDNRKPECTPSPQASSSASAVEPTSTIKPDDGDDDCTDDDDEPPVADPSPAPAPEAPKNVAPAPPAPSPPKDDPKPSDAPKPKPSEDSKPKPKPAPAPKPPSNNGGNDGGLSGIIGNIFKGGIATYFFQNGVAGACGTVHQDSDFVVALQTSTYAGGSHCGKKIRLQNTKTGHTEVATVADECPTCNDPMSVDLSHALFNAFASDGEGIFPLSWGFIDN